jgi:hypothetical protein
MTRWVVIVSGAIPFVFVDDVELDMHDDVVEVIETNDDVVIDGVGGSSLPPLLPPRGFTREEKQWS